MSDFRRPFGPDDLPESGESAADIARALVVGRELDAMAARDAASPSDDFVDRVMTALASEPTPRPVTAAGRAVREGRLAGVLAAFRDTWRVAFSSGRPLAVRAQALALVLIVVGAVGAVGAIGGSAAVGALGLLDGPSATESVPPASPSPLASPSVSPVPSTSPPPSASPSPTSSQSATPTASPTATGTAEPTDLETETPGPTGTDDSDDRTPDPTKTPDPTRTPDPTDESDD